MADLEGPSQMLFKIDVLKNFTIFTGKLPCLSLFLIRSQARNFIKKRFQQRYFLVNIVKFLRTTFFMEHPVAASIYKNRKDTAIYDPLVKWYLAHGLKIT